MAVCRLSDGPLARSWPIDVTAPPPPRDSEVYITSVLYIHCSRRVGSTGVLYRCQGLLPVAARAFGLSNRIIGRASSPPTSR